MATRILLLFSLVWVTHLTQPLFQVGTQGVSGRDLVLLGGGLFLLAKSVLEMHHTIEDAERVATPKHLSGGFAAIIVQIGLIDIVFALDSVFTAIGLVQDLAVMVAAIIVAILVMSLDSIARFIGAIPPSGAGAFCCSSACARGGGLHFEIKGYRLRDGVRGGRGLIPYACVGAWTSAGDGNALTT
jgi:hypothetical protein